MKETSQQLRARVEQLESKMQELFKSGDSDLGDLQVEILELRDRYSRMVERETDEGLGNHRDYINQF